jgi:5'-AMP-activated protein kinase regulatory gamma subunit
MAEADASAGGPLNEVSPGGHQSSPLSVLTNQPQAQHAFVAPSDYLRPRDRAHAIKPRGPMSPLDHEQLDGLVGFRPPCSFIPLAVI